jgi:hypothetical protein
MYGQYFTVCNIDCIMWRSNRFHGNKDRNPDFYTSVALTSNFTNCFHREAEPRIAHICTVSLWLENFDFACLVFPIRKWQTHKISFSIRITSYNRYKNTVFVQQVWFRNSISNLTILTQDIFFIIFFTSSSTRQHLLGFQIVRQRMWQWKRNAPHQFRVYGRLTKRHIMKILHSWDRAL